MKIFNSIQPGNSGPVCRDCAYFQSDPAVIEDAYPGLKILSSAFASVCDRDGICNFHHLYLSARDSCPGFVSSKQVDP